MRHLQTRWTRLLALSALLGTAACAGPHGEEPLYVLRDSMGRSVAMAGASQLGGAAPGTMLRANLDGREQSVMVGERVGLGPRLAAASAPVAPAPLAPAPEAAVLPPVSELPLVALPAISITPLAEPEAPPAPPRRPARRARPAPPQAEPSS